MSDFYNERRVKKTKMDHKCFGCREKLPIGSECFYIAGVYEGDFGTHYLCLKCKKYLDNYPERSYSEGDIRDAMLEDEEWKRERYRLL